MVGNKLLVSKTKYSEKIPEWSRDFFMFWCEMMTVTTARMVMLSAVEPELLAIYSLLFSMLEITVRTLLTVHYLADGAALAVRHARWGMREGSTVDKVRRVLLGQARIADNHGDMVVEYVSIVISTFILEDWKHTGMFEGINSAQSVGCWHTAYGDWSWTTLALLAQILPEMISDVWCIWCECKAGLGALAVRYWMKQLDWRVFGLKVIVSFAIVPILATVKVKLG